MVNDNIKRLELILLPQWEITMESDEDTLTSDDSSDDEEETSTGGEQDIETIKTLSEETTNFSADEISKYLGDEMKLGKMYTKFQKATKLSPDQVIRYQRSGEPLWISDKDIPVSKDIPDCEFCGAPRIFEFQIMPQMLNCLSLDVVQQEGSGLSAECIDWGVLMVFTCSNSCDEGQFYKTEFIWKQEAENDDESSPPHS